MKKQCRDLIEASLRTTGKTLGIAYDSGDCFYHSIAQLLWREGIDVSVASLRNDICEALENPDGKRIFEKK